MVPTLARVPEWKAVVAAMVYFATIVALGYGVYAAATGGRFLDAALLAFPPAFIAAVVFFACSAGIELIKAAFAKSAHTRSRIVLHS